MSATARGGSASRRRDPRRFVFRPPRHARQGRELGTVEKVLRLRGKERRTHRPAKRHQASRSLPGEASGRSSLRKRVEFVRNEPVLQRERTIPTAACSSKKKYPDSERRELPHRHAVEQMKPFREEPLSPSHRVENPMPGRGVFSTTLPAHHTLPPKGGAGRNGACHEAHTAGIARSVVREEVRAKGQHVLSVADERCSGCSGFTTSMTIPRRLSRDQTGFSAENLRALQFSMSEGQFPGRCRTGPSRAPLDESPFLGGGGGLLVSPS